MPAGGQAVQAGAARNARREAWEVMAKGYMSIAEIFHRLREQVLPISLHHALNIYRNR